MDKNLLDEKHRPLPICNIVDKETGTNFYVSDMDDYKTSVKKFKNLKYMFFTASIVLCLFLCIFTLNIGTSGWTVGNLVTFILITALMYCAYYLGREWFENQSFLNKLQNDGVPCLTKNENSAEHVIHCSRNKNFFIS